MDKMTVIEEMKEDRITDQKRLISRRYMAWEMILL
jgi:hypothetical protein